MFYVLQQERLDIEEKYTSLQEEAQGKTKKLKKVWTMLMAAKSEVCFAKLTLSLLVCLVLVLSIVFTHLSFLIINRFLQLFFSKQIVLCINYFIPKKYWTRKVH